MLFQVERQERQRHCGCYMPEVYWIELENRKTAKEKEEVDVCSLTTK